MTNKDYKRLTVWSEEVQNTCMSADSSYERRDDIVARHIDRLYELENAIENSTLVFLPCKVGDTVWFVNKCRVEKPIEAYIVDTITILQSGIISIEVHQAEPPYGAGLIRNDYFGKNVFFTKETAKKHWRK